MLRGRFRLSKLSFPLLILIILYFVIDLIFSSSSYEQSNSNKAPAAGGDYIKLNIPTRSNPSKNTDIKYLLLMTRNTPLNRLKEGQKTFIENNCDFQNCFLTSNISYLKRIQDYDAVLFGSPNIQTYIDGPERRYIGQKYIFASTESAAYCRAMDSAHDNFYSLTWTYRLDSDILWRHFRVFDMEGNVVGPSNQTKWMRPKTMQPTPDHIIKKFKHKSKAAVWFVSTCKTLGRREEFVSNLAPELENYGWAIDIFGACGNNSCRNPSSCPEILENYFFYLSFENSIEEDFVTEKVLDALNNFLVPIVYGGADYSRFLPPGSYLNAKKYGPKRLADKMNDILRNMTKYQNFFKWTNHYTFEPSLQSETCNLCAAMNNETLHRNQTKHQNFRIWWNGDMMQNIFDFLFLVVPIDNVLNNLTKNYNFTQAYRKVWFEALKKRIDVPSYVDFLNQNVEESLKERDELDNNKRGVQSVLQLTLTTETETMRTEIDYTSVSETVENLVDDD